MAGLDDLVAMARAARANAYAPYSSYAVGAAIRDTEGGIWVGVNVENASYGATICAERGAIMAMVAGGSLRIAAIAVATRDGGPPCGMCLQVIGEFASPECPVLIASDDGLQTFRLGELIPHRFAL
ncbi:cytidine deaminase [bacterium]|nr:MAG: cytidine deaminase [bacterium]